MWYIYENFTLRISVIRIQDVYKIRLVCNPAGCIAGNVLQFPINWFPAIFTPNHGSWYPTILPVPFLVPLVCFTYIMAILARNSIFYYALSMYFSKLPGAGLWLTCSQSLPKETRICQRVVRCCKKYGRHLNEWSVAKERWDPCPAAGTLKWGFFLYFF